MPSLQQDYSINPEPAPPKRLQLDIDVAALERDKVEGLQRRLEEFDDQLKRDFPDIQPRISVRSI